MSTMWTCPDCDHRQYGGRFVCTACGANFGEVADAESKVVDAEFLVEEGRDYDADQSS